MAGDTRPQGGLCWYAARKLPSLLEAFQCEIAGVKEAEDIEYVHRMRVASRRLRAALPLFSGCFPEKQYAKWMQELTRITRALGDARDADVQIAFLEKTLKRIRKKGEAPAGRTDKDIPPMEPALRFLLLELQERRGSLQKHVLSALANLEKRRVLGEMQEALTSLNTSFGPGRRRPALHGIPPVAAFRISRRLEKLLSYESWVKEPEAVAEHHATRIAAKKLRYTMEVYGSVYRQGLKKPLARVKKIQEILGDVHDCDVWIDHITEILLRERSLLRSGKKAGQPDTATIASLKEVLKDRESERKRRYRQFVTSWYAFLRAHIWEDLRTTLVQGRKVRFQVPSQAMDDETRAAVNLLAVECPEILDHSRHVTRLALGLFDELQSLHSSGPRERFLLECAGLLHDIGWKGGEAGHNKRGAEQVITDERLPFDLAERGIIALVIHSHRGKVREANHPYFPILSPELRKKTLILAAILRIADGLDYPHGGTVTGIRCTITADTVTCKVSGTGDLSTEKERACHKADLFRQVFLRDLVIP